MEATNGAGEGARTEDTEGTEDTEVLGGALLRNWVTSRALRTAGHGVMEHGSHKGGWRRSTVGTED
jgi:hypothetical protein